MVSSSFLPDREQGTKPEQGKQTLSAHRLWKSRKGPSPGSGRQGTQPSCGGTTGSLGWQSDLTHEASLEPGDSLRAPSPALHPVPVVGRRSDPGQRTVFLLFVLAQGHLHTYTFVSFAHVHSALYIHVSTLMDSASCGSKMCLFVVVLWYWGFVLSCIPSSLIFEIVSD